jgi:hypothetical protein
MNTKDVYFYSWLQLALLLTSQRRRFLLLTQLIKTSLENVENVIRYIVIIIFASFALKVPFLPSIETAG